jgi:hypothetical protein
LTRPAPAWWWTGGRSRTIWIRPSRSHARRLAGRVRVVGVRRRVRGGWNAVCFMLRAGCCGVARVMTPVFSFQTQKRDTSVR